MAMGLAVVLASCAPSSSIKAGSASAEALVRLLPKATGGVVAIDVHRAVGTGQTAKMLENPQAKQMYGDFVRMAGIDPLKDIYFVVVGLAPSAEPSAQDLGAIVNLQYDREKLLALMKDKVPGLTTEPYNGVDLYGNLEGAGATRTTRAAFLDDSNILFGSAAGVKGIIDVYQKKADPLAKNADMKAILKKVDKKAIAWGAIAIPPEVVKKGAEAMPQLKVLEGIEALTMSFDHRLANYIADIRTMGGTAEQNKNLGDTLTGLKGLGAMMGGQEPVVGEFLDAVEVSSGKDFVRLYISVSEELAEKLGKTAEAKLGDYIKPGKGAPVEDIREDRKDGKK
jgi:hypothetical protein